MTDTQLRSLQPQTLLGERYRLEREVGRGGMAVVWLAHDLKLNRDVAIKVLLGELAFAMGPERFRREIDVVSRLSHPYILAIDDFGEYEGHLYYVMPFIAGETIHKRLERERQLPLQDALRIAYQVASALDYAHKQGIVHRDIKPENILLQNGEALVADFGIARAITEGGGARLTSTGVTLGTPTYMSPEQAMADPGIDGRSDIYSLGCVLYEMIAGQPPFSGPTAQSIIARHALDEVPSLVIVRGTVPEEVEDIVLQSLAKLPADRFASAGDMAEALREIMTGGTTAARKTGGKRRTTTQRRRARQAQASWKRYALIGGMAVPVLAAIAWAAVHFSHRGGQASRIGTDSDPNHIAVLYFDDQSDGKLRALSDGLTESLIDELGAVKQLKVTSRNGVAPYKGKNVSPDSLRKALKVGTIVSGSVAQSGDRLRVKVQLVDAVDGNQLASKTFEKSRSDLFALQDTLAKEVSLALRKQLGNEIDNVTARPGTSNAQAWEALQQVRQAIASVDSVARSGGAQPALDYIASTDAELDRIAAMDKKWAAPVVLKGMNAVKRLSLFANAQPQQIPKWLDEGSKDAEQALQVAPNDPPALELRGDIGYFRWAFNQTPDPTNSRKLLDQAEADLRAATTATPMQASAWNALSYVLNSKNKFSDAKLAAQRAYESDPYLKDADRTVWRLFQNSVAIGNRTESEKWCAFGRQRFPTSFRFSECRLWVYQLPGEKISADSVWASYREFIDRVPASQKPYNQLKGGMLVALGLLRAGVSPDSARAVANRSRGDSQIDPSASLLLYEAYFRAQVGDKSDAIRLLTKFFASNPPQQAFAKDDDSWWWEPIRNDAAYKALVGETR
ncbi:MAG TPA: serine/threonine-protein kinase [Gemmatimonadaceae bacterium]|nr:serine/threonine-protein kinase [Gemmatimonadaceae bacterium]